MGQAGARNHAAQTSPAVPIPEACDLPPRLALALHALVEPAAPTVSYAVPPDPESVTRARHFAVSWLDRWGTGALADDVGLVVCELVTNALRHGGGSAFTGAPFPRSPVLGANGDGPAADPLYPVPTAIRLRMRYEAPWLLCGILDASPAAPRRREPDYIAETGRGLHLVESFSIRWGWCGLPSGKVVWALFRTPPA